MDEGWTGRKGRETKRAFCLFCLFFCFVFSFSFCLFACFVLFWFFLNFFFPEVAAGGMGDMEEWEVSRIVVHEVEFLKMQ